jgi:hypothetical protein
VLRANLPYVKELKAAFVLHPAEGSGLPSLLQSRLNAPRILQVMKVRSRCHPQRVCARHCSVLTLTGEQWWFSGA